MGQLLATRVNPTGELPEPQNVFTAMETLNKKDGFEMTDTDQQIAHAGTGTQMGGHFLIDRDGIVRWLQIEAGERIGDISKFPSDEEILRAARELRPPDPPRTTESRARWSSTASGPSRSAFLMSCPKGDVDLTCDRRSRT